MSTKASNMSDNDTQPFKWQNVFMVYGIIMFLILLVGFFGNLFTIVILRQREHWRKSVTPLMINLAIADLFIIVFGYPVVISNNLSGDLLVAASPLCIWSGFVNGATGMASIATLTALSGLVYQKVKRNSPNSRFNTSPRQSAILIVCSWVYGFITMLPPLAGWNRFVPGQAGFSCAPDWVAPDVSSKSYIVWLIVVGFFTPLIIIAVFYFWTYRIVKRRPMSTCDQFIQAQRRRYQKRLILMTGVTICAFLFSWSPYTFVSLAATIKGQHVLSPGEAEIPELLAKASVIYNPIIYTFMNDRFRLTLWEILSGNRGRVGPELRTRNGTATENDSTQADNSNNS